MKKRDTDPRLQEAIIDAETVLAAVAVAKSHKARRAPGSLAVLEGEPALQEFLKGALLEIAGSMAIHGCPSSITGSVYREVAFLLGVTFASVRKAHRDLFADLLPDTEVAPGPSQTQAGDGLSCDSDGKKRPNSQQRTE